MTINTIFIFTIIIITLLLVYYFLKGTKRKAKQFLKDVKDEFNSVKHIPIKARLNRVKAIAHHDRNYQKGYNVWKYQYDKEHSKLEKEITDEIKLIEKLISKQKISELNIMIQAIKDKIDIFKQKSTTLLNEIEKFIALEAILREEATYYKKIFRKTIKIFESSRSSAAKSAHFIDELISDLENDFTEFEKNMDSVNFSDAIKALKILGQKLIILFKKINIATQIKLFSHKIIPNYIEDVVGKIKFAKEENHKINEKELFKELSAIKNKLEVVEIKAKMKNFDSTKNILESSLKTIESIDKEVFEEIHARSLFFEMLPMWKSQIQKFYVITNNLNPLIATLKLRVELSNDEAAMIIAYKDKLELTKEYKRTINQKLDKSADYQFKQLLGFLKQGTKYVIETIMLVRKVYEVLDSKESQDIRSERELRSLSITFSELSSDIKNNKFVAKDKKIHDSIKHLKDKINITQQLQNKLPRNVKEIKRSIEACVEISKNIANNVYNTNERFNIAEDLIMWMSKYRFQDGAEDLNSLLIEAEIEFNNLNLTKLESILDVTKQTSIIKKNKGK